MLKKITLASLFCLLLVGQNGYSYFGINYPGFYYSPQLWIPPLIPFAANPIFNFLTTGSMNPAKDYAPMTMATNPAVGPYTPPLAPERSKGESVLNSYRAYGPYAQKLKDLDDEASRFKDKPTETRFKSMQRSLLKLKLPESGETLKDYLFPPIGRSAPQITVADKAFVDALTQNYLSLQYDSFQAYRSAVFVEKNEEKFRQKFHLRNEMRQLKEQTKRLQGPGSSPEEKKQAEEKLRKLTIELENLNDQIECDGMKLSVFLKKPESEQGKYPECVASYHAQLSEEYRLLMTIKAEIAKNHNNDGHAYALLDDAYNKQEIIYGEALGKAAKFNMKLSGNEEKQIRDEIDHNDLYIEVMFQNRQAVRQHISDLEGSGKIESDYEKFQTDMKALVETFVASNSSCVANPQVGAEVLTRLEADFAEIAQAPRVSASAARKRESDEKDQFVDDMNKLNESVRKQLDDLKASSLNPAGPTAAIKAAATKLFEGLMCPGSGTLLTTSRLTDPARCGNFDTILRREYSLILP